MNACNPIESFADLCDNHTPNPMAVIMAGRSPSHHLAPSACATSSSFNAYHLPMVRTRVVLRSSCRTPSAAHRAGDMYRVLGYVGSFVRIARLGDREKLIIAPDELEGMVADDLDRTIAAAYGDTVSS